MTPAVPAGPRVLLLVPARTYRAADFLLAAARMGLDLVIASDGALPVGSRPVIPVNPGDPDASIRRLLALQRSSGRRGCRGHPDAGASRGRGRADEAAAQPGRGRAQLYRQGQAAAALGSLLAWPSPPSGSCPPPPRRTPSASWPRR